MPVRPLPLSGSRILRTSCFLQAEHRKEQMLSPASGQPILSVNDTAALIFQIRSYSSLSHAKNLLPAQAVFILQKGADCHRLHFISLCSFYNFHGTGLFQLCPILCYCCNFNLFSNPGLFDRYFSAGRYRRISGIAGCPFHIRIRNIVRH